MSLISPSLSAAAPGTLAHVAQHCRLQPAEAEIQIPFHRRRVAIGVRHARQRQRDGLVVALSRALVDEWAARISQAQQPRDLIVRLPRRIVARPPDARVGAGLVDEIEAGVAARHDERNEGQRQIAVLQEERLDVAGEVVHRHERTIEGERERLGELNADEKRTDEAGTLSDGDGVERLEVGLGGIERRPDDAADVADVLARRELGHHTAPLAMDGDLRGDDVRPDRPRAAGLGDHGRRGFVTRGLDAEDHHFEGVGCNFTFREKLHPTRVS